MRSAWAVRERVDPLTGERFFTARRAGRPTVLCAPVPGTVQKFALVAVRFGAKDLSCRAPGGAWRSLPPGTAHFLEHQLFEGESVNALDRFARLGVSANAYTDYDETAYHVACVGRFPQALAELLGFVRRPGFTAATVRKEKGIIAQEIRMYQDDPDSACAQDLHRLLYARHPVRIDIAGTVASVRRTGADDLYAAYWGFYHPANLVVAAAGKVSLEDILAATDAAFSRPVPGAPAGWRPSDRPAVREPGGVARRSSRRRMPVARPKALLGFKETRVGLRGEPLARQNVATVFAGDLLFGPASEFRESAEAEGLIDDDFGFARQSGDDFGYSVVGGRTRDPAALRRKVLARIDRVTREGVPEEDFAGIRAKSLGGNLKTFHSPSALARALVSCHFTGIDLFDYRSLLGTVGPEDLLRRVREHFREELSAMAVVTPE